MAKWLAAAAVALIAVLLVLWKQLGSSDAAAVVRRPPPARSAQVAVAVARPEAAPPAAPPPAADPTKIDPKSDEFFYQFEELVVPMLSRDAVKCYETLGARVHRNQDLVLGFKHKIENGRVTIHDVVVKESTLNNPALEACFIQQIRNSGWTNERLPDMPLDEDEIVLNPERGLKKYTRENIEYVGAEGPKWEGGI